MTDGSTGMSPEGFRRLYDSRDFRALVAREARRYSSIPETVEDLSQQAWMRLLACSSESSTGDLGAAIHREVESVYRAELRERKRWADYLEELSTEYVGGHG
jgi:hypothetical protein